MHLAHRPLAMKRLGCGIWQDVAVVCRWPSTVGGAATIEVGGLREMYRDSVAPICIWPQSACQCQLPEWQCLAVCGDRSVAAAVIQLPRQSCNGTVAIRL